jgi:subtilisin family serine protease
MSMSDPAQEPVRVMIELRAPTQRDPNYLLQLNATWNVPTCQIELSFAPVSVPATLDAARSAQPDDDEEHIIVCASILESHIRDLEVLPEVVKVWYDAPIAPHARRPFRIWGGPTSTDASDWTTGPCAVPECDCRSWIAKGNIADVANYLGVDEIWRDGYRGQGITIGIVDSGIKAIGRVPDGEIPNVTDGWPEENWGTIAGPYRHGHMTATDALGMAPEAKIFDIRYTDAGDIDGYISQALGGFQWAIQRYRSTGAPHILSNSWGIFQESWEPGYANDPNHPFTRKVVEAMGAGILVLFSAGNCGEACPSSRCGSDYGPGRSIWGANGHPDVMTVGAANIEGQLVGYSSQGPAALSPGKPDFLAISHFQGYGPSDTGTSAACPIAAGVVATLKQAFPGLTQEQGRFLLRDTARDIGPPGFDHHTGAGILDAGRAYHELMIAFFTLTETALDHVC